MGPEKYSIVDPRTQPPAFAAAARALLAMDPGHLAALWRARPRERGALLARMERQRLGREIRHVARVEVIRAPHASMASTRGTRTAVR